MRASRLAPAGPGGAPAPPIRPRGFRVPALVLALLGAAAVATAADGAAAAPANYVAGFVGTTAGYRPPGGPWDGWQHDATLLLGYGRFVGDRLALELDVGPTLVRGDYASTALVPGVVWTVHRSVYLAARLIVPVDPDWNLVLFPGVGLSKTVGRVTPILELNVSRTVGRGGPDLGVALTAGLLVGF